MLVLSLGFVLCFILILRWLRTSKTSGGPQPPSFQGSLPVIGHMNLLLNKKTVYKKLEDLTDFCLANNDVASINIGPMKAYVFSHPDECLALSNSCLRKMYFYNFYKYWLGGGLFCLKVDIWKRTRKLLFPAFSFVVLNAYIPIFNAKSKVLVERLTPLAGKGPVNLTKYLLRHNLETMCHTTMNLTSDDYKEIDNYIHISKDILRTIRDRMVRIWLHPDFIYRHTWAYKKHQELIKTNKEICNRIIAQRKKEIQIDDNGSTKDAGDDFDKFQPLLDLMLKLSAENNAFQEDNLIGHICTFILGTYDTSTTTLIVLLVLLGTHTSVQDKVLIELEEIFSDSKRDVEKEDLHKLVYLEAVIKETMRLYPVAPMLGRVADQEVKIKNYTFPSGSLIVLLLHAVHRHSSWGPDAKKFRPERWFEKGGVPENPNTFAGFSMGKRDCIGKRYGMMSMKITLVHLLREFRISGDINKVVFEILPMLKPTSGHQITLELKNNNYNYIK